MAANVQAMCTSFKKELLQGVHSFCQDGTSGSPTNITPARSAGGTDTIKAALFVANPSTGNLTAATTAYSTTNEVTGTNYTAGGVAVTINPGQAVVNSTSGVVTPSSSIVYGTTGAPVTLATAFDTVLLYNSSQANRAISVHTFGSQTITAGVLTLTMPNNVAGSALIELA